MSKNRKAFLLIFFGSSSSLVSGFMMNIRG